MRSLKKYQAHISATALAVSVISAILHTISMLFCRDNIGYYAVGAVLPTVSNIFMATCIIAFAVSAIIFTDSTESVSAPEGITRYTALIPAAALILHSAELASTAMVKANASHFFTLITALVSAIFFIMIAFSKDYTATTAVCGIGFIVWLGLSWLSSYNDLFIPMNSPEKLFFHFGCIGAAILTIGELRSMYEISRPRLYRFSLWSSQLLLLSASLPSVIEFLVKNSKSSVFYESLVLLGLAFYAVVRNISLIIASYRAKKETTLEE